MILRRQEDGTEVRVRAGAQHPRTSTGTFPAVALVLPCSAEVRREAVEMVADLVSAETSPEVADGRELTMMADRSLVDGRGRPPRNLTLRWRITGVAKKVM